MNFTHARYAARSLLALALILGSAAQAAGINDTGITDCWNDSGISNGTGIESDTGTHPRQDCRYGRDPANTAGMAKLGAGGKGFDFTKIANDGSVLGTSATLGSGAKDWACTKDNVTGLLWEVKTISGLRSQSHSYTWYNSNSATNGGSAGTASGGTCATTGRCDTEKFVADVNAAPGLCGATDWRMPSKKELIYIVDYGRTDPSIDPSYFPNTPASYFWSASASANDSSSAWLVSFGYGYAYSYLKDSPGQVRLVRAGQ